jgi:hypothetical protein
MIFRFVVRRLRWLAHVPLLPHFFDAMLLAWTASFNRPRLRALEALLASIEPMPDVRLTTHRFGGTGFLFCGREVAHVHSNGLLDAHVGRQAADQLIACGKAEPHHVFGRSAWISFWLRSPADIAPALKLLENATAEVA